MILPQKDDKYYGVVHIDDGSLFVGYCREVMSCKCCLIDIFINKKKLETIEANEDIEKLSLLYEDAKGYGFCYKLPDKYFQQHTIVEFKAQDGYELTNSKIRTSIKK